MAPTHFKCPQCGRAFAWKPDYAGRNMRCRCGRSFIPRNPELAEGPDDEQGDYAMMGDDDVKPVVRTPAAPPPPANSPPDAGLAAVAALYPHRSIRAVEQGPDVVDAPSPFRNVYLPLALLVIGVGLRLAQLLYANEGHGNRWTGNIATPSGVGKAVLLVAFEMILASVLMYAAAFAATVFLEVEFGPLARAAVKLSAAAVFGNGVAAWIALFDQDAFSVSGLVLALHVMVLLNWILLGYFFKL